MVARASSTSSITSTRATTARRADGTGNAASDGPSASSGRVMRKLLPCPLPSLWAEMHPPCRLTSKRAMASPKPNPPCLRATACVPCTKESKTWGSSVVSMPAPSSVTRSSTLPAATDNTVVTVPPASVNLQAFTSRLVMPGAAIPRPARTAARCPAPAPAPRGGQAASAGPGRRRRSAARTPPAARRGTQRATSGTISESCTPMARSSPATSGSVTTSTCSRLTLPR